MKKVFISICLIISTLCAFALENKKVAVLDVTDIDGKLSTSQKLMLRTNLAQVVSNTDGFEAYDRANLDAIMAEHNFQRSGLADKNTIRELGKLAGVTYILLPEGAVADENNLYVTAQLLNVETGRIEFTASELVSISAVGMKKGCETLANKIFDKLQTSTKQSLQEEEAQRSPYYIYREKNGDYSYMGKEIDKKTYLNFLKNNCPEAYRQYNSGTKMIISGWCLFGVGLAGLVGGSISFSLSEKNYDDQSKQQYWDYYSDAQKSQLSNQYLKHIDINTSIMSIGGALFVASVPLLTIGYINYKKALQTYNKNCSSPSLSPIAINLTASQNGLGLALVF